MAGFWTQCPVGRPLGSGVKRGSDHPRSVAQIGSEYRKAQRPQRQRVAFGVQVDRGPTCPAVGKLFGDLGHVPGESGNMVFGEDRLQRAAARQPLVVGHHQQVVAQQPTDL